MLSYAHLSCFVWHNTRNVLLNSSSLVSFCVKHFEACFALCAALNFIMSSKRLFANIYFMDRLFVNYDL